MSWIFCHNHTAFGNDTWCGAQISEIAMCKYNLCPVVLPKHCFDWHVQYPRRTRYCKARHKEVDMGGWSSRQQPPIFRLSKFNHICFSKNLNLFCVSFCQWRSTEKFYEPKLYWCQKAVDFLFFKQKCSCEGFILFFCSCHFIEDNMKKTHNKAWLVIKLHF